MTLLNATYRDAAHNFVAIEWLADGSANVTTGGEVADETILALVAAEGADVDGWNVELN